MAGFLPPKCVKSFSRPLSFMTSVADKIAQPELEAEILAADSYLNLYPVNLGEIALEEQRYLYSVLSMAFHRYVWLDPKSVKQELPTNLGNLWLEVSRRLGIAPVLTHAAVDLWNWSLKDPTKPFSLDNLQSNHLMLTGEDAKSEEWFYLVMVAIEGLGGKLIGAMECLDGGFTSNPEYELGLIHAGLREATALVKRMYERCDSDVFFNKLRVYLGGSDNKEYFPEGLKIGDQKISYGGGSAAQSTLIPVLDSFFGVKHTGHGAEFLERMHQYMPLEDRQYLLSFRKQAHYKPEPHTAALYSDCIEQLCRFRQAHLGLVHNYIMKYLPKKDKTDAGKVASDKGTGGTSPVEFCSELISDTAHQRQRHSDEWGLGATEYSLLVIFVIAMIAFRYYMYGC